ncbi:MAG: hypothetical protein ACT4OO_07965 [Nitrospiraceae bacterium]
MQSSTINPLSTLLRIIVLLSLTGLMLLVPVADGEAKTKRKSAPRPEPDLKIVQLSVSPNPYSMTEGSALDFALVVELPKDLEGATMLEVSSLVSSASKNSFRFLSSRRPVESGSHSPSANGEANSNVSASNDPVPRVSITLQWDGRDQNKHQALAGSYHYEVRAKLLSVGEKGLRTQMTSWPKRGTVEVK